MKICLPGPVDSTLTGYDLAGVLQAAVIVPLSAQPFHADAHSNLGSQLLKCNSVFSSVNGSIGGAFPLLGVVCKLTPLLPVSVVGIGECPCSVTTIGTVSLNVGGSTSVLLILLFFSTSN